MLCVCDEDTSAPSSPSPQRNHKAVFLLIRRQTHYRDSAVDLEALSVAPNAPRWLRELNKKHGYIPAVA